jgi:predicted  nucleic acid-binding Zn-ribbon protein
VSDILEELEHKGATHQEAMKQRIFAAQEIRRLREDEKSAVEYRRVLADELEFLRRELEGAERLIRRAYGAIGTLRRTSDIAARKSYSDWQDEANAWLAANPSAPAEDKP